VDPNRSSPGGLPPIILSEAAAGAPEDPSRRDYTGWVLLAILFFITLWFALAGSLSEPKNANAVGHQQRISTLRSTFDWDASIRAIRPTSQTESRNEAVQSLVDQVAPTKNTSVADADLWLALTYEIKGKIARANIPDVASEPYQAIYGSSKLSANQVRNLSRQLDSTDFLDQLALAHASKKAGDPRPYAQLGNAQKGWWLIGGVFVGGIFMLGGLVAGIAFASAQSAGKITYRGHPQSPISLLTADRLALRAAQLFLAFFVISMIPAFMGQIRFADFAVTIATGTATILAAITLAKFPIGTDRFSLKALGISSPNLGRHIGLGLLAFCIELPIALIVGVIGTKIFSFLPEPHHPASDALATASPAAIFAVFFSACIVAPFWEEIMFRGLLFPAISRVAPNASRRVLFGAIASSLLFASIHPQGIALWFALGTVGVASCILVQYSRSLVPSVVMHAAHNFTLLVVGIVVSR
jgi:membrane protease YdiL (CAAX protease family)